MDNIERPIVRTFSTKDVTTSWNQLINSGQVEPVIGKTFRKLSVDMLVDVLKEIKLKQKKVKNNFIVTNSKIMDDYYTWEVVMNNKN